MYETQCFLKPQYDYCGVVYMPLRIWYSTPQHDKLEGNHCNSNSPPAVTLKPRAPTRKDCCYHNPIDTQRGEGVGGGELMLLQLSVSHRRALTAFHVVYTSEKHSETHASNSHRCDCVPPRCCSRCGTQTRPRKSEIAMTACTLP